MITEDYVSFETAKLLKEKGFDKKCEHAYFNGGFFNKEQYGLVLGDNFTVGDLVFAPTLQMAMKWLREACGITISIEFQAICPTWKWRIYIKSSNKKHIDFQHYNKYEEAVEAAIKYCLENLLTPPINK